MLRKVSLKLRYRALIALGTSCRDLELVVGEMYASLMLTELAIKVDFKLYTLLYKI